MKIKVLSHGIHDVVEKTDSSIMLKDLSGTYAFPPFRETRGRLVPIPQQKPHVSHRLRFFTPQMT